MVLIMKLMIRDSQEYLYRDICRRVGEERARINELTSMGGQLVSQDELPL